MASPSPHATGLRRTKQETELELGRAVDRATDRLIEAARRGDIGAARAALEAGADTHRPTPVVEGWDAEGHDEAVDEAMLSPLGWAAKRGNREMAALLIDEGGADPNQARTADGATALIEAADHGHLEVARLLLDRSADPNLARTDDGSTALIEAASEGHLEVARLLLDRAADPNLATTDEGCATALMCAASEGHLEVVRLLLDRAADPNLASTDDGGTALMEAACGGHLEVARLLLDRAADPNLASTDGFGSALIYAASNGRLEVAQLLLLFGADPDVEDDEGETAQAVALDCGHPGVAACLGAVAGWPAFKIAAACRLHADARRMLHRGTVDPSDCSLAELLVVGRTPANTLWPGSPGPCDATAALARAAMSSWSPGRHLLHHLGVRSSVWTTLLVAHRLRCRHAVVSTLSQHQLRMLPQSSVLIGLPTELWLAVCSFFRRSDAQRYAVTSVATPLSQEEEAASAETTNRHGRDESPECFEITEDDALSMFGLSPNKAGVAVDDSEEMAKNMFGVDGRGDHEDDI